MKFCVLLGVVACVLAWMTRWAMPHLSVVVYVVSTPDRSLDQDGSNTEQTDNTPVTLKEPMCNTHGTVDTGDAEPTKAKPVFTDDEDDRVCLWIDLWIVSIVICGEGSHGAFDVDEGVRVCLWIDLWIEPIVVCVEGSHGAFDVMKSVCPFCRVDKKYCSDVLQTCCAEFLSSDIVEQNPENSDPVTLASDTVEQYLASLTFHVRLVNFVCKNVGCGEAVLSCVIGWMLGFIIQRIMWYEIPFLWQHYRRQRVFAHITKSLQVYSKTLGAADRVDNATDPSIVSWRLPNPAIPNNQTTAGSSAATRTVSDDPCAICYDSYDVGDVVSWSSHAECTHCFHKGCIRAWLCERQRHSMRTKSPCPMCQRPFVAMP